MLILNVNTETRLTINHAIQFILFANVFKPLIIDYIILLFIIKDITYMIFQRNIR